MPRRDKSHSARTIAAHPFDKLRAGSCKKRKDGAPSFGMAYTDIHEGGPPTSTLHVTGQTFLDPTATFANSNIGGDTSMLFTAHIDTSFAYNPLGALIHLIRDVLHIGGPRKPC
jgi:hypothetical protein